MHIVVCVTMMFQMLEEDEGIQEVVEAKTTRKEGAKDLHTLCWLEGS